VPQRFADFGKNWNFLKSLVFSMVCGFWGRKSLSHLGRLLRLIVNTDSYGAASAAENSANKATGASHKNLQGGSKKLQEAVLTGLPPYLFARKQLNQNSEVRHINTISTISQRDAHKLIQKDYSIFPNIGLRNVQHLSKITERK